MLWMLAELTQIDVSQKIENNVTFKWDLFNLQNTNTIFLKGAHFLIMSGSHRRNHHGRYKNVKPAVGDKGREVLEQLDEDNPVLKMFKEHSLELDDKHDRYERIIKLGRDITIESKRITFLLHNCDTLENKREQIFKEADTRLNKLISKNFLAIAQELDGHDSYLYCRAYTSGLQEFIEALVFYQYLSCGEIDSWEKINAKFNYTVETQTENKQITLMFPQTDFILGIADFTGELMRKCINNLGSGNIDDCFKTCNFVKCIYTGFKGINCSGQKEMSRKLYVLRQSLSKMELVCYNIRVRGSEIPKHMLASVVNTDNVDNEEDEGFY